MKAKIFWIIVVLISAMVSLDRVVLFAQAPRLSGVSLFADVKANRVGDIITLVVSENTSSSNLNNTQTDKRAELTMNNQAGTGALKNLIPGFGASSTNRNRFQGTGSVSSNSQLTSRMSTRIVKILENGYYMIEGSKEVETNGEKSTMSVTGIIRPEDIASNNTILSSQVAELQVFLTGKGVSTQGNRPGIFTRILNWIF
ncbi:MAG: flagellar basal body L-ring protein FlgH [Patescibacteria group bacterium]|nr:flagellar basal body L-ring protein FlgH [Patescibacteria group bacterium]